MKATVLVAFIIQFTTLFVIGVLLNVASGIGPLASFSGSDAMLSLVLSTFVELAMLSVMLFIVAIVIRVVLNWLGRHLGPISEMLADLTEPLMRPVRRVIPPLGVVDLSVYIVIVLLIALNMMLRDLLP